MVNINTQEYLEKNYPKDGVCKRKTPDKGSDDQEGWNNQGKKRTEIKKLDISNQELEGELIIKDFPNLEKIKCGSNKNLSKIRLANLPQLNYFHANNCQLEDIEIKNCPNINYLNVANNLLTDIGFLNNLNSEKLTILSIHSNNFPEQGLEIFSKFTNLQQLFLDNCDKAKFRKDIYNRFAGSLQPLKNLSKLEILSIGKTDIDSGLEYFPKNFRKIGFNSAIKVETGCSKISQELEEAAKIEGVTEKLQQHEENDPAWISGYYRLAPWRQALELLGEEEFRKQNTQQWLDKNYPKEEKEEIKKRENIIFLSINDKNLKGHLDLRGFVNLEKLDCSDNKLTGLDLSKCSKLTHLYCDNNLFTDLNFLKNLPHPEKLKEFYLGDNEKLIKQNLDFLIPFTELTELNIENCPFYGNLKSLKNMENLERIYISNTDIDDDLDDLPENCQRIYCDNSQGNKKSTRIVKQLNRYSDELFDKNSKNKKYYNLDEWKRNRLNNMIAETIPLERLYVIRGNVKQFIKKWGIKKNNNESKKNDRLKNCLTWPYDKISSLWKEDESNLSELSKLRSPEELWKHRGMIYTTQFIGRGAAVVGAVLLFRDLQAVGGGIATAYPLAELLSSKLEESLRNKKSKWKEFLNDTDSFLDNYHELLGIISQFKTIGLKPGKVSEALKSLDKKIEEFLKNYDKDGNREIDIEEIIKEKGKLIQDLSKEKKSKIWEIVDSIKELETEIVNYCHSSYYGLSKEAKTEKTNVQSTIQLRGKSSEQEIERKNQTRHVASTGANISITNLKRRMSHALNSSSHDLISAQSQEEKQIQSIASSSSEYNSEIQIPPK